MDPVSKFDDELTKLCLNKLFSVFHDDEEIAAAGAGILYMASVAMIILSRGSACDSLTIMDTIFTPLRRDHAKDSPAIYEELKMKYDEWREKELPKKAN
jgi:hypothetical protein